MDNLIISLPQFTETPIYTDYYYRALRNDDIDTIDQYTIELIETIDILEGYDAIEQGYFMTIRDQYHNYNNRTPEYKGHDEEWEWKQLPFNINNEYNYSQYMEYDSMINEQEFDRIDKSLTSQDRIDMGIDTDLPF